MNIKLRSLELTNFKGARKLTVPFKDNTNVFGDNGTGKTTLADAFLWLLFGKNSEYAKEFGIKTLTPDEKVIHKLDHEVAAILEIDGREQSIKRCYREKWVKKRGEPEPELTGHETTFFVNDVPFQAREFQAFVDSIIKEDMFKILTNPAYFSALPWATRRETLIRIAGGVKDEEIIAGKKEFQDLFAALADQRKSIEDYKKEIASKKKKLKDELDTLPGRIDEVSRMIPAEIDFAAIEKEIADWGKQINDIDKTIEDRTLLIKQQNDAVVEHQGKITQAKVRLQQIQSGVMENLMSAGRTNRTRYQSLQNEIGSHERDLGRIEASVVGKKAQSENLEKELVKLRAAVEVIGAKEFTFDESTAICPTCKRQYETSDIEATREKMEAAFNTNKLKRLEDTQDNGKRIRADQDALKAEIEKLEGEIAREIEVIATLRAEVNAIPQDTTPTEKDIELALSNNEEYVKLNDHLKELEASTPKVDAVDVSDIKFTKSQIQMQIDQSKARLSTRETIAANKARLEELQRQEGEYAQQISDLEKSEFVIANFSKAKIDSVTSKINSMFSYVKFRMFDTQVNGAVVECCETLVNGVPFSDLNNGARINAGREIINVLSKHYGIYAPVFTDNAESVTELLPMNCQTINLVVSKPDKVLRIE